MIASQLTQAMQIAVLARVPIFIKSSPGGGKTALGHQTVKAMGWDLRSKCLAQTDALDARGLPEINAKGFTTSAMPEWLPRDPDAKTVIYFDEFTKAPLLVMNVASELLCEGTIGGPDLYKAPKNTSFILTGNRRSDRAGENEMPTHLKNRVMHIEYETDLEEWIAAAYRNFKGDNIQIVEPLDEPEQVDETIIGFHRRFPGKLSAFSTTEDAYASPRSWNFVNRLIPYLRSRPDLQLEMFAGCVGQGLAIEYTGWLRLIDKMFDPNLAFTNPDTCPVPEEPSVMFALITALASRVTKATANSFFTYMMRIPQDFAATCVVDAMAKDTLLMTGCPMGVKWGSRNHKMMVG